MLPRSRWLAVAIAVLGCRARATGDAASPESMLDAPAPAAPPVPAQAAPLDRSSPAYQKKLLAGFDTCGNHPFTELGGSWVTTDPQPRDVWLCEGRILWRTDWGGMSELCVSTYDADQGDAEVIFHEDVDDPGDASGLYISFIRDDARLTLELADWEAPQERHPWFVLARKPGVAIDANAPCPAR